MNFSVGEKVILILIILCIGIIMTVVLHMLINYIVSQGEFELRSKQEIYISERTNISTDEKELFSLTVEEELIRLTVFARWIFIFGVGWLIYFTIFFIIRVLFF